MIIDTNFDEPRGVTYTPIDTKLYDRIIHLLPNRDKVRNDTICIHLDGQPQIYFEWCSLKKWVLLNPLMIEPRNRKVLGIVCRMCNSLVHTINKEATRVRCDKCAIITDIRT